MHFTREPIIETIISPKEGYKLVVRNSKGPGHEEFFVDSLQVVIIGQTCFYRSLEKPKAFFVPASDYEVLEVRETRVALKMPSKEPSKESIKIAGGRETNLRSGREKETRESAKEKEAVESREEESQVLKEVEGGGVSDRIEKRRRRFRKRHKEEVQSTPSSGEAATTEEKTFIIPPPVTLISETISRYREMPDFAGAFYEKTENGNGARSDDARVDDATRREREMHQMQEGEEEDEEESIMPLEESLEEEGREFLSS